MSSTTPDAPRPDAIVGATPAPTDAPASAPAQGSSPYLPARADQRPPAVPSGTRERGGFKRGFGVGFGASLGAGVVLTALSIITTLGLVLGSVALAGAVGGDQADASAPVTERVWGPADASSTLLAVPVQGTILGSSADGSPLGGAAYGYDIARTIDDLGPDDYDGIVLEMNTPGGTIYGARAIADAVGRYQERSEHPVVAFVRGISASGGMYAMAGADEIIADHGSLVGSIGVVSGPFERYRDVTGIPGSLLAPGVETEGGITSEYLTEGEGKDFGNPYRDMTEEERAVWQNGLANEYSQFVDAVSEGRDIPAQTIRDDLGAYLYDGGTAVEKGLVDRVLGQEEAYREAAKRAGADPEDTAVDRISTPGLLESLLSASSDRVAGRTATTQAADAQIAARTSVVCSGPRVALVYSGDLSAVCPAP